MSIPGFHNLLSSFPKPDDPLGFIGTWRENAMRRALVPVIHNWRVGYAIDDSGAVFSDDDDRWLNPRLITDRRERHPILAEAARRFPELATLMPVRTSTDIDCPSCKGASTQPGFPDIICDCGNLG